MDNVLACVKLIQTHLQAKFDLEILSVFAGKDKSMSFQSIVSLCGLTLEDIIKEHKIKATNKKVNLDFNN